MAFDISYRYLLVDQYSARAAKIAASTDRVKRSVASTSIGLQRLGQQMSSVKNIMAASTAAFAISIPVREAADFESKMADIQKSANITSKILLSKLGESFKSIGTQFGRLPKDIAEMAFQAAKMDIPIKDMEQFVSLTSKSAVAFDMADEEAGRSIAKIKGMLGLNIAGTEHMLDTMNYLADHTRATGAGLVEIMARAGIEMRSMEFPIEFAAGFAAFAEQVSITPRKAAMGINLMLAKLQAAPRAMEKIKNVGANKTILDLLEKYAELPDTIRAGTILKHFGQYAGRFVKKAVERLDLLKLTLKKATDEKAIGSMFKELQIKMKTADFALKQISAASSRVKIAIGDAILPIIAEYTPAIITMAEQLSSFLKQHPGLVKLTLGFVALLGVISTIVFIIGMLILSLGFLLSPIGLITTGILSLGTGFVVAYKKSSRFKKTFLSIRNLLTSVYNFLGKLGTKFGVFEKLGGFLKFLGTIGGAYLDVLTFAFNALANGINSATNAVEKFFTWYDKFTQQGAQFFSDLYKDYEEWDRQLGKAVLGDIFPNLFADKNEKSPNAVAAKNQMELNGNITVGTVGNASVKSMQMDMTPPGMLGFNMGY